MKYLLLSFSFFLFSLNLSANVKCGYIIKYMGQVKLSETTSQWDTLNNIELEESAPELLALKESIIDLLIKFKPKVCLENVIVKNKGLYDYIVNFDSVELFQGF